MSGNIDAALDVIVMKWPLSSSGHEQATPIKEVVLAAFRAYHGEPDKLEADATLLCPIKAWQCIPKQMVEMANAASKAPHPKPPTPKFVEAGMVFVAKKHYTVVCCGLNNSWVHVWDDGVMLKETWLNQVILGNNPAIPEPQVGDVVRVKGRGIALIIGHGNYEFWKISQPTGAVRVEARDDFRIIFRPQGES